MATPTIAIPAEASAIIYDVLNTGAIPVAECYAIINYSEYSSYQYLASVVGFNGDPANWNIEEHGSWFTLIALEYIPWADDWRGALQGTQEFTETIAHFPITDEARAALGGETDTTTFFDNWGADNSGGVYFPFAGGTSVIYGTRGVHSHGNMNAVDFVSYNASGMAPNAVYAAQSGYVSNICRDDTQMGLKIGNFYYLHLVNDMSITEGSYYGTHQVIGQMVTGTFNDQCGWASQQPNHWHLHFAFPGNGLRIESWQIQGEDFVHDNGARRSPGQVLGPADWTGAAPPPDPEEPPEPPTEGETGEEPQNNGEWGVSPLGTNFWSFLVGGFRAIVSRFSSVLPNHQSIDLALKIGEYAVLPAKIIYVTGVMNYGFAFSLMGIVLLLEGVRFIYSIWMWVKRAIPVVG